jgi:hypothetical protein|nr:MAG TPA: hypothetical protein [Caudoviricetes sp.]
MTINIKNILQEAVDNITLDEGTQSLITIRPGRASDAEQKAVFAALYGNQSKDARFEDAYKRNLGTFRVTHTFGGKTWIADLENEEGTHRKLYWSPSDESFSIS